LLSLYMSEDPSSQRHIDKALDHFSDHAAADGITLNAALELLGAGGYCVAAFLLAVPFVQPIPLGPITMLCGISFITIGWQMGRGHQKPSLPKRAGDLLIHGKIWLLVLGACRKILGLCRRFTRERYSSWVSGKQGDRLVGWLIFIGGVLLAIPAANLPLNNFFPALMILFACIGWLERDGLMVVISIAWGVVTLLYFTMVGLALYFFGNQIWKWIDSIWR